MIKILGRCTFSGLKTSRFLIGGSRCERRYSMEGKPEGERSNEEVDDDYLKKTILDASLPFVQTHGWSVKAIAAGAEAVGYPGMAHGMFSKGGYDLVHHFYQSCNDKLVKLLIDRVQMSKEEPLMRQSERERVEWALETRLRMILPYSGRWPQALALSSLPRNANLALANLLTLVDDICYHCGDRSVDMTWYSKRLGVAVIYKMTELYMLQDASEEKERTWEFLHRRMEEASQLKSFVDSSDQAVNFTKELGTAAFITARNILGMNWNR